MVRFIQRGKLEKIHRLYDRVAIIAATVLTPIGGALPSIAGLLPRTMFAVAYFWFKHAALFVTSDDNEPGN